MTVEQYNNEYKISRSFTVHKSNNNEIEISNFIFEGQETDSTTGQRIPINGQVLLDRIFPFQIRKYSMFKGETELNVFENEEALANLVNLFSNARHLEKYTEKGAFLREKAENAVDHSTKLNQKNQKAYNILESEISQLEKEKERLRIHLNSTEEEKTKLEKNIKEAEKYVDNAEALQTINKRIKNIEEKISDLNSKIDENYTTSLFDENWILVNFESFHKEFAEKVSAHSKTRRELQSAFDKQKGIIEGEKKAKAELLNNAIPLPNNVPSKAVMEEMLNDEICKVCNREAKRGSEPYEFMMKRMKTYLESQVIEDREKDKDEPLFKFDYTYRLDNLNISHEDNLKNLRLIRSKIKDLFEFNDNRKKDVEELKEELEKEIKEREKILGNARIANEDKLLSIFKNYTAWQEDFRALNKELKFRSKLSGIFIRTF
jgi:DNA sulfur modification protein DndD